MAGARAAVTELPPSTVGVIFATSQTVHRGTPGRRVAACGTSSRTWVLFDVLDAGDPSFYRPCERCARRWSHWALEWERRFDVRSRSSDSS